MKAGKLDRLIRIEVLTLGDNGYGTAEEWAPFATVWAQYIPSAGKEAREQMGEAATLPATFGNPTEQHKRLHKSKHKVHVLAFAKDRSTVQGVGRPLGKVLKFSSDSGTMNLLFMSLSLKFLKHF